MKQISLFVMMAMTIFTSVKAQQPFSCQSTYGYLFQGSPTGVYKINMATGAYTVETTQLIPGASNLDINGVGYNPLDNYMWGHRTNTNEVVRVGSDWTTTTFAIPGLPTLTNLHIVGDVSSSGVMYLFSNAPSATNIYRVDVNALSPNYLTFSTLTTTATNIADWAFSPIDGNLYGIGNTGFTLYRFNPTTGARTNLGVVTGGGLQTDGGPYGAVYMEQNGDLYVSSNTSGKIYQIASPHTGGNTAVLFATGPLSSSNDGTRCAGAPVIVPPIAVNDSENTVVNTPDTINVLVNDTARTFIFGTLNVTTAPQHGTYSIDTFLQIIYTPATDYADNDTLYYTVTDTSGLVSNIARVVIVIQADKDEDGIANINDLDDDNDGIPDMVEAGGADAAADADNDNIPNYLDTDYPAFADANSDNVNDNFDKDKDGIIDQWDLDADNDGIPDLIEARGVDINGDGRADTFTDINNNGLADIYDTTAGGTALPVPDTDADGTPDYKDLDADSDGIPDVTEAGGIDSNNDGLPDGIWVDADLDGFVDTIDPVNNKTNIATGGIMLMITGADTNNDGRPESYPVIDDFDHDGLPDVWDIDSDNDGITDVLEAGLPDTNTDGYADGTDTDNNGWSDTVDALAVLSLQNTDGLGKPDYLDIDAENDGIVDNIEAQTTTGYIVPTLSDADNNGLADVYEITTTGIQPVNTDGDGSPDFRDGDTDGDLINDIVEGWDTNGNGTIDGTELSGGIADVDSDGLPDGWDADLVAYSPNNNTTPTSYPGDSPSSERDWRTTVPLPVTLVDFTLAVNDCEALLNWRTGIETETNHFEVLHSSDSRIFAPIATLKATGSNSDYHYAFKTLIEAKHYFRLKAIDIDGQSTLSHIITGNLHCNSNVQIYPNPVINEVTISGLAPNTVVKIMNTVGRVLLEKETVNGYETFNFKGQPAGIYSLIILQNNQMVEKMLISYKP